MRYHINEPDASAEVFEEEVLAINLGTGDYHSLRGAGVVVWRLLAEGHDSVAAARWLAAHWDRDEAATRAELEALATSLVDRQVLRPAAASASPAALTPPPWLAEAPRAYAEPILETYADMQDLLLIDPIHEVDVTGWPHQPEPKPDA